MNPLTTTSPSPHPTPPDSVVEIRITPDGRVLFHDLLSPLLPVAVALAPHDASLLARAHAAERLRKATAP